MPSSDWRAPAAYAHADHISAAGFAWEYLRRDEDYRRDFRRIKAISSENPNARIAFSERWGCDFATDPDQPADRARLFWLPALLPDAFELSSSVVGEADPAAMPVDLAALPGLDLRSAVDGASYGLWRSGDLTHQFWLADPLPLGHGAFCVVLPLDMLLELRIAALLRFWRALRQRPPGDWHHDLPPQTRSRHVLTLRALDGKLDGASYRQIAEALLGFHGRKADWETDPRKNQTRRLVADGLHYMRGGYRDLLHYPVRLPPQR